jgi:hypothetical protein
MAGISEIVPTNGRNHRSGKDVNGGERRGEPRIPVDGEVRIDGRGASVRGSVVDASASGVLMELTEPLTFLDQDVGLEITTAAGGVVRVEGRVVRRALSPKGRVMLAVRLVDDAAGRTLVRRSGLAPVRDYGRRRRPSRAKPRGPRPVEEVRAELRGLGSRVLDLALADPEGIPPEALLRWLESLGDGDGDGDGAARPRTNRSLLREIAQRHATVAAG